MIYRDQLKNLTVVARSLVKVDLENNDRVDDGYWVYTEFMTIRGGKQIKFGMLAGGNRNYDELFGMGLYKSMRIGRILSELTINIPGSEGKSIDDLERLIRYNKPNISDDELKIALFSILGIFSHKSSVSEVLAEVADGGFIDLTEAKFSGLR